MINIDWSDAFKLSTSIIASVAGASAAIFGLSGWLGKVWAGRILSQEKTKQQKQVNVHLTNLEQLSEKVKITFNRLHDERIIAIKNVYGSLSELELAARQLTQPRFTQGKDDEEEKFIKYAEEYAEKGNEYLRIYKHNAIYFDGKTEELLENLYLDFNKAFHEYTTFWRHRNAPSKMDYWNKMYDVYLDIAEKKIPPIKENLKLKFRQYLGVE